jgi:dTDP-glucose 4,6-dehydratase
MVMRLLVTGGCGFIGANFVRLVLNERPEFSVVNLDKLTYAGNLANLEGAAEARGERYQFVRGDICDEALVDELFAAGVDAVVHFAAESHVDRSIEAAGVFIDTNVGGTRVLLDAARRFGAARFVMVSTDEVYGSLGSGGAFREDMPLAPNSPYSASKAAADLLCRAFHVTYGLPVIVTRCSNNYGPYQFPEKLLPLMLTNALEGAPLPVYGDGLNVRDWIYVEDHCRGLLTVLETGVPGQIYNLGGASEQENIELVRLLVTELARQTGRDAEEFLSLITHVTDRPGHDRRYAMNFDKIRRELGWSPRIDLAEGLRRLVAWYLTHETWWREIKSGAYRDYYRRMYDGR